MNRYDQYIKSLAEDVRKEYPDINITDEFVREDCSLVEEYIKRGIDWADKHPISPNPVDMTQQEKDEAMSILTALGICFTYITLPPTRTPISHDSKYHLGLNIAKNQTAINMGLTVSQEVKDQILKLIKDNTPPEIWNLIEKK